MYSRYAWLVQILKFSSIHCINAKDYIISVDKTIDKTQYLFIKNKTTMNKLAIDEQNSNRGYIPQLYKDYLQNVIISDWKYDTCP